MTQPSKKEVNTIYIMSKGRPQCLTAKALTRFDYPGEWFIVCGNNDDKIEEYKKNWGNDKVLVFDWYEQIKKTNTLDNFGFEKMSSGATPARNAIKEISLKRGEKRHWQFDDDYNFFRFFYTKIEKFKNIKSGQELEDIFFRISKFADKTKLANVGFATGAELYPNTWHSARRRVFNAHNMDNENWNEWESRMNDDLINSITNWKKGNRVISFCHLGIMMKETQSEKGGLTELYQKEGTVRKTAYAVLIEPSAVKLVIKYGRYHHKVDWNYVTPKTIHEKHKKI